MQAVIAGVSTITSEKVNVVAPQLNFNTTSVNVGKGLKTYYYEAFIFRSINGSNFNGIDDLTVNLSCSSILVCNVPATVTIPAGQSYVYFQIEGVGIGNTTITTSAIGYSALQDLAVNVVAPNLSFQGPSNTNVGSNTNFVVSLSSPGGYYGNYQTAIKPITVNLTSSNPTVAEVPSSIIIDTGATASGWVSMKGLSAGTTSLTASGSNLNSSTSSVVTVNP